MHENFPYFAEGPVIHGFGRGSKQLGIPTANFPDDVVGLLPPEMECGVYFGWASVDHGDVHKMVMSIGYNPYFNNTKKTMETHIMNTFDDDFYGSHLKILITGHMRPQLNFASLDAKSRNGPISSFVEHKTEQLIDAIHGDIREAWSRLDKLEHEQLIDTYFFARNNNRSLLDHKDTNANVSSVELIPDTNANCDIFSR